MEKEKVDLEVQECRFIFNSGKRELRDVWERRKKGWHRKVKLTLLERKLLMLLSDNEFHRYEEMEEYLYEERDIGSYTRLTRIMSRLKKKLKNYREIEIKTRIKLGYNLKGKIYIE